MAKPCKIFKGRSLILIPNIIPSFGIQIVFLIMSKNEIDKLGTFHVTNDTNSAENKIQFLFITF